MTNGNLYQIRSDIDALVESAFDAETGEIMNEEIFAQLTEATQDEEAAIENVALEYKNAAAWEAMMDAEINVIKKRKELYSKRAERLKNLLLEVDSRTTQDNGAQDGGGAQKEVRPDVRHDRGLPPRDGSGVVDSSQVEFVCGFKHCGTDFCSAFNYDHCEGEAVCKYALPADVIERSKQRANARLRSLPLCAQQAIGRKYYDNEMPWRTTKNERS